MKDSPKKDTRDRRVEKTGGREEAGKHEGKGQVQNNNINEVRLTHDGVDLGYREGGHYVLLKERETQRGEGGFWGLEPWISQLPHHAHFSICHGLNLYS